MSLNQIKTYLQGQLNTVSLSLEYDLDFILGDDYLKYLKRIKNADGSYYVPGVVSLINKPVMVDDVGLLVSSYELVLYGFKDTKEQLDTILDNLTDGGSFVFDSNTAYAYFGTVQKESQASNDGNADSRVIYTLDVELHVVVGSLPSNLSKVEILDDEKYVKIPYTSVQFKKDKALTLNTTYSDSNDSIKLVTDTLQLEMPIISTNAVLLDLLANVLDSSYNKKYTLKWTLTSGITKEWDVILKVGWINYIDNPNPITFGVILERALPRKTITVDSVALPCIQFTVENNTVNSEAIVNSTSKLNESTAVSSSLSITALFSYDESEKADEIIDEMNGVTQNTTFEVSYDIGENTYTHNMYVLRCNVSALESGDMSYQVTFGVKRNG